MKVRKIFFHSLHSTNAYAKDHASTFSHDELTCIIADKQTAGYGQFGRKWISPKGVNLYITFFFCLPANTARIEELAVFMGKVLKTVLEKQGVSATLKWPNDLIIGSKKLAGVLCETIYDPSHIAVILGFGLNVNMGEADLMKVNQAATSLKLETGQTWDRDKLLDDILKQFLTDLPLSYKIF